MNIDLRQLSEREREILQLVASGLSNQQIAGRLGISVNTVKVHLRNIFAKIGAASRTEATMYAVRGGLVTVHVQTPEDIDTSSQPVLVDVAEDQEPEIQEIAAEPETEDKAAIETPLEPSDDLVLSDERNIVQQEQNRASIEMINEPSAARRARWPIAVLVVAMLAVLIGALWATGTLNQLGVARAEPTAVGLPKRWVAREPMSLARAGFAIASFDDLIYVAGGESSSGVSGLLERYDPGMQTWTGLSQKPTPVTDIKAVVIGGKMYIPGGRRSRPLDDITTAFEAYDFRTDSWEKLPDLPEPRSGYSLATVEGKLLLFGGWDGRAYSAEVLQYDPAPKAWSERTPMPTARAYADAALVGGTIYVLGGENEGGTLDANEQYLPTSEGDRPWAKRKPLPEPRTRFGTAVALNLISVLGGVQQDATPIQYDVRTDNWTQLEAAPEPVGSLPGVIQSDVLAFAFGGKQQNGEYSNRVQAYQSFFSVALPQVGGNPK